MKRIKPGSFLSLLLILITAAAGEPVRLKLATTTSVDYSGLLSVLLLPFEQEFNVKVDVVAVGTGQALKLAERGDADIILVHAPEAELEFVNNGFGLNRLQIAWNDFVLVGPADDPAQTKGGDAIESFKKIAGNKSGFVSRGDDSGTHKKEKTIWEKAGIKPSGKWYMESGQGMGQTLNMANEKKSYCLCDRGSYLFQKDKLDLVILCEGDKLLYNPYSVMAVNPYKHPHAKYVLAMALIGWLTSPEGQKIIGDFKKDGMALFNPQYKP